MSTPNPFEEAAIPSAIAICQAFQTFNANMGTDPTRWGVNFPGAVQVFLGSVELQGPAVAQSEAAALSAAVNAKVAAWIAALEAAQAASAKAALKN